MKIECCENCKYLKPPKTGFDAKGFCRRFPPKVAVHVSEYDGEIQSEVKYPFPLVALNSWCGEYKAEEQSNGQ